MPCKQCKDGKYKWGNTGECKYATKDECEKANPKKYNKMKNRPTPIGKKTYEEYAKELKEFNLSQVERVDLASVKELNAKYKALLNESNIFADLFTRWNTLGKEIGSISDMQKKIKNFVEETKAMDSKTNSFKNNINELEAEAKKLEDAAKELGVGEIPAVKQAMQFVKNDTKSIGVVEKALKSKYQ